MISLTLVVYRTHPPQVGQTETADIPFAPSDLPRGYVIILVELQYPYYLHDHYR